MWQKIMPLSLVFNKGFPTPGIFLNIEMKEYERKYYTDFQKKIVFIYSFSLDHLHSLLVPLISPSHRPTW